MEIFSYLFLNYLAQESEIEKAFWVILGLLRIRWTTAIFKVLDLFL